MEDLLTKSFESNPITISENTLTVHLDKLNQELQKYNLRIDSFDDININKELSDLNPGDVLEIFVTRIEPDGDWDTSVEKWFFNDVKEMEDKFESSSEIVSSASLDRGDLLLTIVLNKKGVSLNKKFESGGGVSISKDAELLGRIEEQLKNSPAEVFKMVGIDAATEEEFASKKEDAKEKAFAHYKALEPKPVMVFIHGRKMNLGQGATLDSVYLQSLLYGKCHDYAVHNLRGSENPKFAEGYASNKSILGVDMIRGLAMQKGLPVFHVTDDVINDVVGKICE